MKLDKLMAERIRLDARLAYVPRPIIDAVCSVFVAELTTSVRAHTTSYELTGEVHTCCDCGQIVSESEAVSDLHEEWLCMHCHHQSKTQPDITAQDRTTTEQ